MTHWSSIFVADLHSTCLINAGINAAKDDTQHVTKHIKLLENKLDKALVRLNESVNRNKLLRDDIDHLRKERVIFHQVPCRASLSRNDLTVPARSARKWNASCMIRSEPWPAS